MNIDTQTEAYSFEEYLEYCKWHLNTEIVVIPFDTSPSDYSHGAHLPTNFTDMKFAVRFSLPEDKDRFNQTAFSSEFYKHVSDELARPASEALNYGAEPDEIHFKYNPFNQALEARTTAHSDGAHSDAFEAHCQAAYSRLCEEGLLHELERWDDLPLTQPQFCFQKDKQRTQEWKRPFTCSPLDPLSIQTLISIDTKI